ncbi:MAG: TolC family protein, partial [Candidatus Didemnitutus sp.]|nr:TolC family protein [Candidatus Didemnitutus sp.]
HDTTRDEMLPAAQAWIASVESGIAVGRFDVRELLEARTALFTARRRQIQSAADYHLTLVALEQLLGGPATL